MTIIEWITICIFVIQCSNTWGHNHNLYNTDKVSTHFSHHCFHYTIKDHRTLNEKNYELRQTIEYCIRPVSDKTNPITNGSISSISTFDQLKRNNITTQTLLDWSADIDLTERYQHYLQTGNLLATGEFRNCSSPWFGPFCQYRFYLSGSFSSIVSDTFRLKGGDEMRYSNDVTCYTHLKCVRGPPPICLDWREICDGKIDCLDGGEDEKHCHELKINQCAENEYQCRNGMCINDVFLLDSHPNLYSPECLDGSDEVERNRPQQCSTEPGFQCEDTMCRSSSHFSCGNGQCVSWPIKTDHDCHSFRNSAFDILINWHIDEMTPYVHCWKIIICSSKDTALKTHYGCRSVCNNTEECGIQIRQYCSSLFIASPFSMWDNPERLGFFVNQTLNRSFNVGDMFICFNPYQCPFLTVIDHPDNATCLSVSTLRSQSLISLRMPFVSCASSYQTNNMVHCSEPSMVRCWGMNKCIPKRYVIDGIPDCHGGFDESLSIKSCELNDSYRFRCKSEMKCLSPTLLNDAQSQCVGGEDELGNQLLFDHISELPFSALCDGWTDMFGLENETDETHCERWPCVNQYTRCNGVWNCPKGMDELNCPSVIQCPVDYHPCISPTNYTMACLHVNRTDDGVVDCLGATDERAHCRSQYPNDNTKHYRCWNDTKCVPIGRRCLDCGEIDQIEQICEVPYPDSEKATDYLQLTNDLFLHWKEPFSVQSSHHFPEKEYSQHQQKTQLEQISSNDVIDRNRLWFCSRGILVLAGENQTEHCLCPSSYYGRHCEYQEQRVVLTLRLHKVSLVIFDVIGIVITLVDHTGFIHSYAQLTYIPIHDCSTKFIVHLLYQDRPKDMNKNYTVNVDAYDKVTFLLFQSWSLPIKFLFMPVNRLSAQLTTPARSRPSTQSGQCACSSDSLCVGLTNNRSICLCPLTKIGPRCLLQSVCQTTVCMNDGLCVPNDVESPFGNFTCICSEGFSGDRCEKNDTKILISFADVPIAQSLLVHFITVLPYDWYSRNPAPIRITTFKKIPLDQDTATLYMSFPFNILLTQIDDTYYLAILQHNQTPSDTISTQIMSSQRCPHIRELFDQQIVNSPVLRRAKYYHIPCKERPPLVCFHDNDTFMCLCMEDRQANCFHFDYNFTYDCRGWNDCENGARCYQNHPTCPSKTICVCDECF